jgi:hypothetical protein
MMLGDANAEFVVRREGLRMFDPALASYTIGTKHQPD